MTLSGPPRSPNRGPSGRECGQAKRGFRFTRNLEVTRGKTAYGFFSVRRYLLLFRALPVAGLFLTDEPDCASFTVPVFFVSSKHHQDTRCRRLYRPHRCAPKCCFDQSSANKHAKPRVSLMPKLVYPCSSKQCRALIAGRRPYDNGPDQYIWADFNRKMPFSRYRRPIRSPARPGRRGDCCHIARAGVTGTRHPALEEQQAKKPHRGRGYGNSPTATPFYRFSWCGQFHHDQPDMTAARIHEARAA